MLKFQLIGNVGQDAITRETNGKIAISFSLAENKKVVTKDGEEKEKTTWVNCTIWKDKNAENVAKHIKKGVKLYAEGIPNWKIYRNQEGVPLVDVTLNVKSFEFLGGNKE